MAWIDREGNPVPGDEGQDQLLAWLYGTAVGRRIVSVMIRPEVSKAAGWVLSTRLSALAAGSFARKHHIDMSEYPHVRYRSFNDFFTRKILAEKRPIDSTPEALIAPCDSKLSVYEIGPDSRFLVKNTEYTMETLLRDTRLAERFRGGLLLLFRLTVGDYHRYSYPDSGRKGENIRIPGVFHTVNPAANDQYPIYKENTREYTILESDHFGSVLMMEVGAAMVGKIRNHHGPAEVCRGEEKGMFEFGGSTVILCLEKGTAVIDGDILENTRRNLETVVRLGQRIGTAAKAKENL